MKGGPDVSFQSFSGRDTHRSLSGGWIFLSSQTSDILVADDAGVEEIRTLAFTNVSSNIEQGG